MTPSSKVRQHVERCDDLSVPQHEHEVFLLVTEATARELLAGNVPESVKEQARAAIDWEFHMLQLSLRPVAS